MEWYYKTHHADYKPLPPWRKDCKEQLTGGVMEMIYPRKSNTIYVPVELSGEKGKCVFEAAHRQQGVKIFWHLDESYIGSTTDFHQMELNPEKGKHKLVLVDEYGERLEQFFEITGK
jgi:penicillin-binding protein 1C